MRLRRGEIGEDVAYESYLSETESCIGQGLYAAQLQRYFDLFPREQVLVLCYEDIARAPGAFMQQIYQFLGVVDDFVPSMLHERINVARTPKRVFVDRCMHRIAETMRKIGLDALVHRIRKSGVPDLVRRVNTKDESDAVPYDRKMMRQHFAEDVAQLSKVTGRDFAAEWNI